MTLGQFLVSLTHSAVNFLYVAAELHRRLTTLGEGVVINELVPLIIFVDKMMKLLVLTFRPVRLFLVRFSFLLSN